MQPIQTQLGEYKFSSYYSGLTSQILSYCVYPVILAQPKGKNVQVEGIYPFVLGASQPKFVFLALESAFKELWPESDVEEYYENWEVVKWNRILYGLEVLKNRPSREAVDARILSLRRFGGVEDERDVIWPREINFHRNRTAIKINAFLENTLPYEKISQAVALAKNHMDSMLLTSNEIVCSIEKAEKETSEMYKNAMQTD